MSNQETAATLRFGVLTEARTINVGEYVIEPDAEHSKTVEDLRAHAVADMLHAYQFAEGRSPPYLPRAVATHTIRRSGGGALPADFVLNDGRTAIFSVGLLLGMRCLFDRWFFDYRFPIREEPICLPMRDGTAGEIATNILEFCRSLPDQESRNRLNNVLWMKARAHCVYTLAWEAFMTEYALFDALWKTALILKLVSKNPHHKDRLRTLAGALDLHACGREEKWIGRIVEARHRLFHEALSEREVGGDDVAHANNPQLFGKLTRFNDRLLLALCGVKYGFVRSPWAHLDGGDRLNYPSAM